MGDRLADIWVRVGLWLGRRAWFRRVVGPRILTPVDRWLIRRTGRSITTPIEGGFAMLNLTATGATSGRPRTVPLIYADVGGAPVVVGTNWGRTSHPAWSTNLLAHPEATITIADTTTSVRAVPLGPAEIEEIWPDLVETLPLWADYRASITSRDIRMFRLEPL